MESNILEKPLNSSVASRFFACTSSMIPQIVRICEIVKQFVWKPFWFFLRILIWGHIQLKSLFSSKWFRDHLPWERRGWGLLSIFYSALHGIVKEICHQLFFVFQTSETQSFSVFNFFFNTISCFFLHKLSKFDI